MKFLHATFKYFTESDGDNPNTPRACCYANTAECLSCGAGIGVDEYCRRYPSTIGCEGKIDIEGKFQPCKSNICWYYTLFYVEYHFRQWHFSIYRARL